MSIAARTGTVTPAQLARFNRLGMLGVSNTPLFPGQRLYIPSPEELAAQVCFMCILGVYISSQFTGLNNITCAPKPFT